MSFQTYNGPSSPGSTYNELGEGLAFFQGKADFGEQSPVARVFCSAPTRVAQPDDVLISVRAPVGPTNLADQPCAIGRGLAAIRCKELVAPRYLLMVLRALESEITHLAEGQGGGFTCLRKEQLADFRIPVPPLTKQLQIVARVEAITFRLRELIDHTRSLAEAMDRTLSAFYDRIIDR
jgi:type I restriction enzyme, S subunit